MAQNEPDLETRKLLAEIAKLEAEAESARHHHWTKVSDTLKVAGAVIATALGIWAAVTTYRITQLETLLAVKQKGEAERELAAAVAARDAALGAKATAERELLAVESKLQTAQREINAARQQPSSAAVVASLDLVSGNLAAASDRVRQFLPYVLIVPATERQKEPALAYVAKLKTANLRSSIFKPLHDSRTAPSTIVVRFFQPQDRDEAERVLKVATGDGANTGSIEYRKEPTITRYRYYELRLPVDIAN